MSDPFEASELYPERRGQIRDDIKTWQFDFIPRKSRIVNCQSQVINCFETIPYLKLLWNAIESSGCKLSLSRNFSCEICQPGSEIEHGGTYDQKTSQIAICANNVSGGTCCGVLYWNMMEMFDSCYYKKDFKNIDHLACTEIRKANLAPVGLYEICKQAYDEIEIDRIHKVHVKKVATESLIRTKFVEKAKAEKAIDKVFDRCYADLEPIGRRAKNKEDMQRAFNEGYVHGY